MRRRGCKQNQNFFDVDQVCHRLDAHQTEDGLPLLRFDNSTERQAFWEDPVQTGRYDNVVYLHLVRIADILEFQEWVSGPAYYAL